MSTWRPIRPPAFWQRWLPQWLHWPLKIFFQLSIILLIGLLGFVFYYFMLSMKFDMADVGKLPAGTIYYDRKGAEITAPGANSRRLVKRSDIPQFLVDSLRAREDAKFFEHPGIDIRGLARATVRNLKDRDFTQGASTLTMQLARNTFNVKQKSMHRKLLEIALTLRVEAAYTKDEILTNYLNRIYFGAGAYGIEQAARTYFDKSTSELNESECAMIVGIIRGPHIFSPFRNLDAAIEQRNQTLNRLVTMKVIDEARRDVIKAMPVKLAKEDERETQTSYALQAVRRELDHILDAAETTTGSLKVYTTLDAGWQNRLEIELTRAVEDLEHESTWPHPTEADHAPGTDPAYLQYAAVTTESRTGAVLALIGGRNFSHSRFDRTRSSRDLGSAFEPFVAAAAAERGKLVMPGRPLQTGRQIGPAEVARIAKRCGMSGSFSETEDLFRGTVNATPLEMSAGLAVLGNKGKLAKTYLIREIRDASDEVIYTAKSQLTAAISPSAATDAASVLQETAGTRCFTGATGSEKDAWTLRLGPNGSTAIWLGFDKPKVIAPEARLKSLLDEFVKRLGNQ
ncbi:MAG: penicillin-binding protein [Akkermansiaceae bacterium]|nr:penicillin-binding protein [Akkermansiaceae bacterium]